MQSLSQNDIRLESFSFREERSGVVDLDVSDVRLDKLNLFIGNNAQGKSRLFRTIKFVKDLLTNDRRKISTNFSAKFTFGVSGEADKIYYSIGVMPSNEGNNYTEEIIKGKNILLSTDERKLFNEETREDINNFFVPLNIPAISAINDHRFKTIRLIREFFLRMLFIDANKVNTVTIEQNSLVVNSSGTNLAGVLLNWKEKYPYVYKEIINDLKKCFPLIKNVKFVKNIIPEINTELLAINEEGISRDIAQVDWSDGIWRALCILCLPKTQFEFDGKFYQPSLICIDEIENGLDFNTLEYITDYLKDYSDQMQIIMSSHSPLMGKFIHPKNWQIVRRKGEKIRISKPLVVEADLETKLELYRQEFWNFYTKHVSHSDLYEPK